MRAIVLDAPGPPEALTLRDLPVPEAAPGQVLIRVKAFGLNRSELHTRLGLAEGVTFPRVLGIEATGVVEQCPGGEFPIGSQVFAMMGRTFDGGYAEYTLVPATAAGGVVCFAGMLSNQWTVPDFYPIGYLPRGVRLSAYSGDAPDHPPEVVQEFLDAVATGTATIPLDRVYDFDRIVEVVHPDGGGRGGGQDRRDDLATTPRAPCTPAGPARPTTRWR